MAPPHGLTKLTHKRSCDKLTERWVYKEWYSYSGCLHKCSINNNKFKYFELVCVNSLCLCEICAFDCSSLRDLLPCIKLINRKKCNIFIRIFFRGYKIRHNICNDFMAWKLRVAYVFYNVFEVRLSTTSQWLLTKMLTTLLVSLTHRECIYGSQR